MTPSESIKHYLEHERRPVARATMAAELVVLGCIDDWPRLTSGEWNKHIDDAVSVGIAKEVEGLLNLNRSMERLLAEEGQLELF